MSEARPLRSFAARGAASRPPRAPRSVPSVPWPDRPLPLLLCRFPGRPAKALDLTMPQSLIARADEVIE